IVVHHQLYALDLEQFFVLLNERVSRLGEDRAKRIGVERVQVGHYRQTAEQLGDEAEMLQVLRIHVLQQVFLHMLLLLLIDVETDGVGIDPAGDELVDAVEGAAADKENVLRIDLDELLLGVLAAALRGYQHVGAFQQLQHALLYALAAYIAGDGGVI